MFSFIAMFPSHLFPVMEFKENAELEKKRKGLEHKTCYH